MRFVYQTGEATFTVEIEKHNQGYSARINGEDYPVELLKSEIGELSFAIGPHEHLVYFASDSSRRWVFIKGETQVFESSAAVRTRRGADRTEQGEKRVRAPMPGQVRAVNVTAGELVEKGHTLMLLEAMKMEIRIQATRDGRVHRLLVEPGQAVERDQVLAEME